MEELPLVTLGCLLHDIGKILQRADGDDPPKKSHSEYGYDFLSGLTASDPYWQWVLESVRYHHWRHIKEGRATLPIAWFTFEADNLASAHDRKQASFLYDADGNRVEETDLVVKDKWDKFRHLDSPFANFTRSNPEDAVAIKLPLWYRPMGNGRFLRDPYPYPGFSASVGHSLTYYQNLRDRVLGPLVYHLKEKNPRSLETVNSVFSYLEENLSMTPPDTYKLHTNDVSLFDHLKLTAAIGSCMCSYVGHRHPEWLKADGSKIPWGRDFRKESAYLLGKADISGIQEFIYNISSKAALKGLRGRSFYLELLLKNSAGNVSLSAWGCLARICSTRVVAASSYWDPNTTKLSKQSTC